MQDQSQYAAAAHVPFIKSPSLRIPRPIAAPQDIHPLPDDINAYFVYPFTLEPHILTLESSRTSTLAAHSAKHEAYFRNREEIKQKRQRDALHRVAPGFEPQSAPLVPTKVSDSKHGNGLLAGGQADEIVTGENNGSNTIGSEFGHQRNVMDDLVDHLAALDAATAERSPAH